MRRIVPHRPCRTPCGRSFSLLGPIDLGIGVRERGGHRNSPPGKNSRQTTTVFDGGKCCSGRFEGLMRCWNEAYTESRDEARMPAARLRRRPLQRQEKEKRERAGQAAAPTVDAKQERAAMQDKNARAMQNKNARAVTWARAFRQWAQAGVPVLPASRCRIAPSGGWRRIG